MGQFFLSSWRSGFRNRAFFGIFFLGLVLVGVAYLSSAFSPRQPQTVALDVGLSGLRFCLILFSISLIQDLVGREIERRSIILTLSYPASRASYLIGRYLGVIALCAVAAVILGLLLWLAVIFSGAHYEQQFRVDLGFPYWTVLAGIWLDTAVVAAFALWISTISTVPLLPLALGAVFAIAGKALGAVVEYVATGADGQDAIAAKFAPLLNIIRWMLPDLSRLDWRAWAMYGTPPDVAALWIGVAAATCYAVAMIGFAIYAFSHREFS